MKKLNEIKTKELTLEEQQDKIAQKMGDLAQVLNWERGNLKQIKYDKIRKENRILDLEDEQKALEQDFEIVRIKMIHNEELHFLEEKLDVLLIKMESVTQNDKLASMRAQCAQLEAQIEKLNQLGEK